MKYLYLLLILGVLQGMRFDCEKYNLLDEDLHSLSNSSLGRSNICSVIGKRGYRSRVGRWGTFKISSSA